MMNDPVMEATTRNAAHLHAAVHGDNYDELPAQRRGLETGARGWRYAAPHAGGRIDGTTKAGG